MPKKGFIGARNKTWVHVQRLDKLVQDYDPTPADWITVYKLRVTIEPLSGREFHHEALMASNITHQVFLRWMPGIDSTWRLLIVENIPQENWRILNIDSVIDVDDYRRDLELRCIEQPNINRENKVGLVNPVWDWQDNSAGGIQHDWQDSTVALWQR